MSYPSYAPIMLQHVNLTVPEGTLPLASEFYGEILGFGTDPVPQLQRHMLLWFRIGDGPQQIHVAHTHETSPPNSHLARHHPCFRLASPEALLELQQRIFQHSQGESKAKAIECDAPGAENSGSKGVEYPTRFFARDFAGNRLEFSV